MTVEFMRKGYAPTLTFQPETNISTAPVRVKPQWRKARRKVAAGRGGVARGAAGGENSENQMQSRKQGLTPAPNGQIGSVVAGKKFEQAPVRLAALLRAGSAPHFEVLVKTEEIFTVRRGTRVGTDLLRRVFLVGPSDRSRGCILFRMGR